MSLFCSVACARHDILSMRDLVRMLLIAIMSVIPLLIRHPSHMLELDHPYGHSQSIAWAVSYIFVQVEDFTTPEIR
jgi:hypothetical protein